MQQLTTSVCTFCEGLFQSHHTHNAKLPPTVAQKSIWTFKPQYEFHCIRKQPVQPSGIYFEERYHRHTFQAKKNFYDYV